MQIKRIAPVRIERYGGGQEREHWHRVEFENGQIVHSKFATLSDYRKFHLFVFRRLGKFYFCDLVEYVDNSTESKRIWTCEIARLMQPLTSLATGKLVEDPPPAREEIVHSSSSGVE